MKNNVFFTRISVIRVLVSSNNAAMRPIIITCDSKVRLSILKNCSTIETRSPVFPEPIPVIERDPITPISKTPKRSRNANNIVMNNTANKRM
jgi:hypothetical protein